MSKEYNTSLSKEELEKALLVSYNKLLEHNSLAPEQNLDELKQLSKYSHGFSLAWFTTTFMDYLINKLDKSIASNHIQAAGYTTLILKSWIRILFRSNPHPIDAKERHYLIMLIHLLIKILYISDNAWISPVQNDAWIALVDLVGKDNANSDTRLLENMADIIESYTKDLDRVKQTKAVINAAVGYSLSKTTALNESCQKLLEAYIQYAILLLEEGPRAIMQVMEYSMDIRSQQTQAETNLTSLTEIAINVTQHHQQHHSYSSKLPSKFLAHLAGLGGIVRALQFNRGKNTKKIANLRRQAEKVFLRQLDIAVNLTLLPEHIYELNTNQEAISLFCSYCLIQIHDSRIEKEINIKNILKILSSELFDGKHTFQRGSIIHRLENTRDILEEVNYIVNHKSFNDIGRISRIMSKLITILYTKKDFNSINHLLDRLTGFSYNVFVDWDKFIFDHSSISMNPEESKNYTDLMTSVRKILRSITFSSIVLLRTVAIDIQYGSGLKYIPHAPQDIISTFANISFIIENLGQGLSTRKIYEQIIENTLVHLLNNSDNNGKNTELDEIMHQVFKEYAPVLFVQKKEETIEVLSMVKQSRLLFYTDLSEQVMEKIDNKVIENDILPVLYPILSWRRVENKNLYESVHSAVISIFKSRKPVCSGLAGKYATILIENFPEPISLNQLRYGYTSLIQALSEIDEVLAWLTTGQLISKMDSLGSRKELVVLHSQYMIVLIDLLKPLSLGPFFSTLLDQIQTILLDQPTKTMQKATMKIIFETISGFDISDMRKTEAIGWYLSLKNKLEL